MTDGGTNVPRLKLPTDLSQLDLRQALALAGFRTARALAVEAETHERNVASMLVGAHSYAKARTSVARALGVTEDELLVFIRNSASE